MRGYPVLFSFPVHWGDMDSLRHVNNARYFTWFESARIAYFERVFGKLPEGTGPILANTTCDFLRPIVYPADVIVGVRVSEVGSSSLRMEYAAARAEAPEQIAAKASSVMVLVRYASLEKVRVPDEVRATIAALEKGRFGEKLAPG